MILVETYTTYPSSVYLAFGGVLTEKTWSEVNSSQQLFEKTNELSKSDRDLRKEYPDILDDRYYYITFLSKRKL